MFTEKCNWEVYEMLNWNMLPFGRTTKADVLGTSSKFIVKIRTTVLEIFVFFYQIRNILQLIQVSLFSFFRVFQFVCIEMSWIQPVWNCFLMILRSVGGLLRESLIVCAPAIVARIRWERESKIVFCVRSNAPFCKRLFSSSFKRRATY